MVKDKIQWNMYETLVRVYGDWCFKKLEGISSGPLLVQKILCETLGTLLI